MRAIDLRYYSGGDHDRCCYRHRHRPLGRLRYGVLGQMGAILVDFMPLNAAGGRGRGAFDPADFIALTKTD